MEEVEKKVEEVLERVNRMLGGAEVRLEGIEGGIVTVRYYRPLTNPAACHVDRAGGDKEIAQEALEDTLREVVPDFKGVRITGEDR